MYITIIKHRLSVFGFCFWLFVFALFGTEAILSTFPQYDWMLQYFKVQDTINFHCVAPKNVDNDDVVHILKFSVL